VKGHDCEKEQQVADALRSDLFSEELRKHAEQCPICSEVILVADFLRQETDRTDNEFGILPDAGLLCRFGLPGVAQLASRSSRLRGWSSSISFGNGWQSFGSDKCHP